MKIRDPKTIRRVAAAAAFVARGWARTIRYAYRPLTSYVVNDRPELIGNGRYIYAFWHEHLLMPAVAYRGFESAVLVSLHADGELLAQVAERFGEKVVRGSTSRGGISALLRMLQSGWGARHLGVTPDGPRGPRRHCQMGVVYLASRTGLPIVTGGFGYSRCWRAKSWDRFAVPLPISRVRGVSAHPIFVPPGLGTDELKPYQKAVEDAANHATAIAEHWAETGEFDTLGYKPPPDAVIVPEHQKAWSSVRLTGRAGLTQLSHMPGRILELLTTRKARLLFTWLILLGAIGHRGVQGWINFQVDDRPDRNDGHTSIDFGGQWMMGRLLVLGHGREMYSRERHLDVARASYSRDREAPGQEHDAERLVKWYPGPPEDPIGGPLYPPIHALVMAPISLIPDPYWAYRITQALLLGFMCLAGAGVRYLSRGRWWWSAATAFLLLFPGCRGGIDLAQNSPVTLTLLIWGWAFIIRGRSGWGGMLWGLLAFKPVWAISFLLALLLLRQWRAAGTMIATGAGLVLITLPFVGVHSWFDWLHVGQLATKTYLVDRNWIFLSRDLFGIPRRIFLNFEDGRAVADRPIAAIAGWALWACVFVSTVVVTLFALRRKSSATLTGVLPAFVMIGMWMCAYRFMYYDVLVAAVAVVTLFADPSPYFRRSWWPFASWAAILVGLLLLIENVTSPLNVEVTASVHGLKGTVTHADNSKQKTAPTMFIASGDYYPWDTATLFALWIWCAIRVLRTGSAKVIESNADVR